MTRDRAPTLLIAAYRLERNAQKTGSFLLRFVKFFPDVSEFFVVHVTLSSTAFRWYKADGEILSGVTCIISCLVNNYWSY